MRRFVLRYVLLTAVLFTVAAVAGGMASRQPHSSPPHKQAVRIAANQNGATALVITLEPQRPSGRARDYEVSGRSISVRKAPAGAGSPKSFYVQLAGMVVSDGSTALHFAGPDLPVLVTRIRLRDGHSALRLAIRAR